MAPDPKPAARIKDSGAGDRARLLFDECAACHRPPTNGHHVLPKGERGDDVVANIVLLCGSGSDRCHGALHGNPYLDVARVRWTAERVREAVGTHILASRPDTVAYLVGKLGLVPAREYLARRYFAHLPADYAVPA